MKAVFTAAAGADVERIGDAFVFGEDAGSDGDE